jgi:hypothetical protein
LKSNRYAKWLSITADDDLHNAHQTASEDGQSQLPFVVNYNREGAVIEHLSTEKGIRTSFEQLNLK